ncbi:MAG: hypothetical protein GC137_10460 [Alphaproteobacteria bacterium]|nr:hypothetical protein [Alphaproteobacteria bacterium]
MKKHLLLIPAMMTLAITACESENPLKSVASQDVAQWVFKNRTKDIDKCAEVWGNQHIVSQELMELCKPTAETLAAMLTKGGFGNVSAEDVLLPSIWKPYSELARASKANRYDPQKAGEAMKLPTDNSLKDRIEAYKEQRDETR